MPVAGEQERPGHRGNDNGPGRTIAARVDRDRDHSEHNNTLHDERGRAAAQLVAQSLGDIPDGLGREKCCDIPLDAIEVKRQQHAGARNRGDGRETEESSVPA